MGLGRNLDNEISGKDHLGLHRIPMGIHIVRLSKGECCTNVKNCVKFLLDLRSMAKNYLFLNSLTSVRVFTRMVSDNS